MQIPAETLELNRRMDAAERPLVETLGEQIGYGRLMQLAERIWDWKQPGSAHSVGPCTSMLIHCPHVIRQSDEHCDWCCGSGRVTRRVLQAMIDAGDG